jgi:thioredoxin reductase (NADPH)
LVASGNSGLEVHARFVLLATGLVNECPKIDGDGPVRFCPVCDGFEATDKEVAVVGGTESGSKKAFFLRTFTQKVSFFVTDNVKPSDHRLAELRKAGVRIRGKRSGSSA